MKRLIQKALAILSITVMVSSPSMAQFQNTGRTSFQGASGSSGQSNYFPQGKVGEAYIESDYDTRSIIIVADEDTEKYIQEVIQNLDRPVPQVLIKVVFVEVTHRNDSDIGAEFSFNADNDKQQGGSVFGLDAQQFGGFYRILQSDLQVTVKALKEAGSVEVLSRPSILTRNNQEAQIHVGQEVPFVETTTQSDSGQLNTNIVYRPIGIILRVTPFITPDGLVEMIISPEISSQTDESVPISNNISAPVFATRSADTVVTTPNGQTVVIGGMMEDSKTETDRKIPILGDIPLLGNAFKRKIVDKTKTELLIFLTPIVVQTPALLDDLTNYENSRSKLVPKTFTDEQMDTYFDNFGPGNNFNLQQPTQQQQPMQQEQPSEPALNTGDEQQENQDADVKKDDDNASIRRGNSKRNVFN
jgi:general secretion pathway protein D